MIIGELTKESRTERAFRAVKAYASDDHMSSHKAHVQDFLTDLRHYCSTIGASFSELDRQARMTYLEELEDESF